MRGQKPLSVEGAVEGFYVEAVGGLIFTVKGLVHPPHALIAFLRYMPSPGGERVRGGVRYARVYAFEEQFEALRRLRPSYVFFDEVFDEVVQGVPRGDVVKVYDPRAAALEMAKARDELPPLERDALDLVELLEGEAGIPSGSVGISGSILVGLATSSSDIDLIVYGERSCLAVHEALEELLEKGGELQRLSVEDARRLYVERGAKVPLERYVEQERRKVYQGRFRGRRFFIRFVKEAKERYGDLRYRSLGRAEVVARVVDAGGAMYTPCTYLVDDVEFVRGVEVEGLTEIASFRGRFCDQAGEGERVAAGGKVEAVIDAAGSIHYRLLLGGSADDYLLAL